MAKAIVVEHQGVASSFAFNKIDRSKLYGRRRRVALDPSAQVCTRAALTDDGTLLVRLGMTAQGYFDEEDRWVPHKDLVGLGSDGQLLESRPSTLGDTVPLAGPVDPGDLLDLRVQAVYLLAPEKLDPDLEAKLLAGDIFRFPFNYRPGWESGEAYLLANTEGDLFALTGGRSTPEWCAPNVLLDPLAEDEDFGDELDFEMF